MGDDFWGNLVIGFMFYVFPWIFVGVGAFLTWKAHAFMKVAVRVTGRVTHVQQSTSYSNGRRSTTYKPTFEFIGPDGRPRSGQTFLASSGRNFAIGSEHEILVDPENLDSVRMPGFWVYGFGGIFMGMGLLFAVIFLFAPFPT